ncbi:MAG: hypothetical protein IJ786_02880 [Bacteroidaceae bacterium]|nr:hypothetical protein [Bacteroidaceae bacterium]
MKRISTLLFVLLSLSLTAWAQSPFELDSLKYIEELQARRIPQLIEVRAEGEATLYASSIDTMLQVTKMAAMPLFLLGDEGAYWACAYLGKLAYVRKSAALNTAAIQKAWDEMSRHYRYLVAYNAMVQSLQLAVEYAEQTQLAVSEDKLQDDPVLLQYFESKHRTLTDALPYLDKLNPKAYFGQ